MLKRILLCVMVVCTLQASAFAATYPVIVRIQTLSNLTGIVNALGGGTVLDSIPGSNIYLLGLNRLPLVQALNPVLGLLGIEFMELDKVVAGPTRGSMGILRVGHATAVDWYKSQPSFQLIRMNSAHSFSTGRGIVVADLNSRVDFGHPALIGHLTSGQDFVQSRVGYAGTMDQSSASFLDQSSASFLDQSSASFLDQSSASFLDQSAASFLDQSAASFLDGGNAARSHGTLCAGVIAAVAPDSMIMPLRVFDDSGNSDVFSIVKAAYFAVDHGAQVINMSFGMGERYRSVEAALAYAAQRNVQVVASAGNNNVSTPQFPASISSVISVAATDLADKKASFSNFGSTVFVAAPGVNIIAPYPGGFYAMVSGTSFSAPIVAAEVALIRSARNVNVKSAIGAAVINIDSRNPAFQNQLGKGRVDILRSVHP